VEHRCSERSEANFDVVLYTLESSPIFGRIINSSKLGFFIQVDDSARFKNFQLLDIEILYSDDPHPLYRHLCKVCVIRKTLSGIGVEIEYSRLEASNIIPFTPTPKLNQVAQMPGALLAQASHNRQLAP